MKFISTITTIAFFALSAMASSAPESSLMTSYKAQMACLAANPQALDAKCTNAALAIVAQVRASGDAELIEAVQRASISAVKSVNSAQTGLAKRRNGVESTLFGILVGDIVFLLASRCFCFGCLCCSNCW